jgi:hypothetical protein
VIRALAMSCVLVVGCSSSPSTSGDAATGDPYAAARAACIAEINRLRATHNLPPYTEWSTAETCVDGQANSDATTMMPHGAFRSGTTCQAHAQNECPGQGVSGIVGCLDQMWAEGQQSQCAGCDACAGAYAPNCPNCDYDGSMTGHVCGHYVNMSARWLTMAACGFSSSGGWDAIDFR